MLVQRPGTGRLLPSRSAQADGQSARVGRSVPLWHTWQRSRSRYGERRRQWVELAKFRNDGDHYHRLLQRVR